MAEYDLRVNDQDVNDIIAALAARVELIAKISSQVARQKQKPNGPPPHEAAREQPRRSKQQ